MLLTGHNRHLWLLPLSLLLAFLWEAWPHPWTRRLILPDSILLVSLYWTLRRPHNMTPQAGFFIGLFRDALHGGLLGQHALSMSICLYLAQLFARRMRNSALWQQSAIIALLAMAYLLAGNWVHLLHNHTDESSQLFIPALATGLCWPPAYLLLHLLEHGRQTRPT